MFRSFPTPSNTSHLPTTGQRRLLRPLGLRRSTIPIKQQSQLLPGSDPVSRNIALSRPLDELASSIHMNFIAGSRGPQLPQPNDLAAFPHSYT